MTTGTLQISVYLATNAYPAAGLSILVKDKDNQLLHQLTTDESGQTDIVTLEAPTMDNSLEPGHTATEIFSSYTVEIPQQDIFQKRLTRNVNVFDSQATHLPVHLHLEDLDNTYSTPEVDLPLVYGVEERGTYSIESVDDGEAFLTKVEIPEFVVVHLGRPTQSAPNVRVPFIDYIKNVTSSEIYPTWPTASLEANVYCHITFLLNRVYTTWYMSKGYAPVPIVPSAPRLV